MGDKFNINITNNVLTHLSDYFRQTTDFKKKMSMVTAKKVGITGSGVLIVAFNDNLDMTVLTGYDKRKWLSSFGGKMEGSEKIIDGILREFIEETLNIKPENNDIIKIKNMLLKQPYLILRPTKTNITYMFSFYALELILSYFKINTNKTLRHYFKTRNPGFIAYNGLYEIEWLTLLTLKKPITTDNITVYNHVIEKKIKVKVFYLLKILLNLILELLSKH
jgi:hypothetical protein